MWGFAAVFHAEDLGDETDENGGTYAVKMQAPPAIWEFYITQQLQERLDSYMRTRFMNFKSAYVYDDRSFLLMKYDSYGSLQDVLKETILQGRKMDESLVMFYTIEMLKLVSSMHACGVIHCDIKLDNFLVVDEYYDGDWKNWSSKGGNGWETKGLRLIDFGRAVDIKLYPAGTKFKGDHKLKNFQCIEMLENRPWTYQLDLFGIVATIHCLLHGEYMDAVKVSDGKTGKAKWVPKLSFKRYWESSLWQHLFDSLMNIEDDGKMPDLDSLRIEFEEFLTKNPSKARSIKSNLVKQNIMMYELNPLITKTNMTI